MKPKYRKYLRKAFPSLIVIPAMAAMLPSVSQAAIIADDTFGNVTLNDTTNNGANTIRANGGTSLTPTVLVSGVVNLNGDGAETEVLEITSAGYTVTLNSGAVFNGTNHDGINSTFAFTLINAGTIDGNGASSEGITTVGGTTSITNSGTIEGDLDAIEFRSDGGTVTNTGTINGVVGGTSDGIEGFDNVSIFNNGFGSITAVQSGVDVNNNLSLTNQVNAVITGTNLHGVEALNNATINNFGSISGGTNGINVASGAIINNKTTVLPGPDAGGQIIGLGGNGITATTDLTLTNEVLGLIRGSTNGIVATDGGAITTNITNNGTITGLAGDGIQAQDSFVVLNNASGVITGTGGSSDGISVGVDATITNNGTITGGDDGIDAGPGATIVNNSGATITGSEDGIDIDGTGAASTITNAGTINGGNQSGIDGSDSVETVNNTGLIQGGSSNAIDLNGGNDVLNLSLGSRVIGDVLGGSGNDILNFAGGLNSPLFSATGAGSNSILGDVEEFDVINKTGTGVAFIGVPGNTGHNVEVNTINITGGGLYINGDISADTALQTIINAGGTALGGTGLWDADIFITAGGISAGAIPINLDVNPQNAVGNLAILGNVTHSSGSFIRHDINPFTGADDLITHSGGTYALGGNTDIRVSATDNDNVIGDGTYTVVDSNAFITGSLPDVTVQFNDNVNSNDSGFVGTQTFDIGVGNTAAVLNLFMESGFTDGGTNLVIFIEHDYEGIGEELGSNEAALGAALDDSVFNSDPLIQDFIAALDYSDIFTVEETLSSLVPDGVFGLTAGVLNSNYRLHRLAQNHLATTRTGTVIEMTPDSVDAKGHTVPGTTSSTVSGNFNVWGTFSYDWQDSDYVDGEVAAFTVGADYRVAPNFLVGLMLDGSQADNDFNGGSSDVDSLRAAIYATYGASTGIYADFLVGYGDHDFDLDRSFGGLVAGTSSSNTDATSLQAMAVVGYAMESGSIKHGPFAGLEYQNIDVDSFTQSGLLPIGVNSFDVESLRALIGYRAEATYGKFTPYASIAYAHEFEDDSQSTTATLPGGATFKVNGGELDSAILLGVGTGYSITPNLGMNIGYRGEISTGDGLDSHGGSIGLNYSF